LLQRGIQAVGGRRPLLRQAADSSLHEAEGLLSCPDLVQQHGEVSAEGSLVNGMEVKEGMERSGEKA